MWLPGPLPRNLEACFRDLRSEKAEVRAAAAGELVRHVRADGPLRARAVAALEAALSDRAPQVRAAAAVALADVGARESLPKLLVAIEDDDAHVREMAIVALGELGDDRAAPRLSRALRDPRPEVRYQAVVAFARVAGDHGEVERALARALDDDDLNIRYIALRVIEERLDVRPCPKSLLDAAARLVHDDAADVAAAASTLLLRAGDARGEAGVLAVVRGDVRVGMEEERGAIEAAGSARLEAARPALERRAWGAMRFFRDTSAWHAKVALACMGDARAVHEIVRDLGARDKETRNAAVVAAGRARIAAARARIEALGADEVAPDLREQALRELAGGRPE
jgi:HEAT repeat protein